MKIKHCEVQNNLKTYHNAKMVEVCISLEIAGRVVFIRGQQLTQEVTRTVRADADVEGKTCQMIYAGYSTLARFKHQNSAYLEDN